MTRDSDVFIPLEQRTAIANREGADLFLSIHANASRNTQGARHRDLLPELCRQSGSRSRRRTRELSLRPDDAPAAGHRAGDHLEQQDRRVERLCRHGAEVDGAQPVDARTAQLQDLGVKQAPFVVLIGAGMPSVLAEISFVTPQAGRRPAQDVSLSPADRRSAARCRLEVSEIAEGEGDDRVARGVAPAGRRLVRRNAQRLGIGCRLEAVTCPQKLQGDHPAAEDDAEDERREAAAHRPGRSSPAARRRWSSSAPAPGRHGR